MSRQTLTAFLGATALVLGGSALAQTNVPHTFVSGQPAVAAEVNENFLALVQGVQTLENSQVSGNCAVGSFVAAIAADGTVICEDGTDNLLNTRFGELALENNSTGDWNTATGHSALSSNTTGGSNTASGFKALMNNTIGRANTANGVYALERNTSGSSNTASGAFALSSNTTGGNNTASGQLALYLNTTGASNTAIGQTALYSNTTGYHNTASGVRALYSNTTGFENTASGSQALENNTEGIRNTAFGFLTLDRNTTGLNNAAFGAFALQNNTTGSYNTALGTAAGFNWVAGDHNIAIDHPGEGADSHTTRIGNQQDRVFISGIRNTITALPNAINVLVDSDGQLGTASSSRRYKQDINDMGHASDRILQLRPVTFRYKEPYANGEKPLDYGLIAEEVAEVFPELVTYNENNEPEAVKYRLFSTLLLNELQKQQEQVEMLSGQLAVIQAQVEELNRR